VTRRHWVAVGVAFFAMLVALVPPLWVRSTGTEVTIEVRPADPLSLFRGNYVDLVFEAELIGGEFQDTRAVYAVFADELPARLLRVSDDRPPLDTGEFCVRGESDGRSVRFPHLEQFFLTSERARELGNLAGHVAVLRVTGRCSAVLIDVEPISARR
jgi:hypothetical protein